MFTIEDILMSADQQGYRLEMVDGLGIWEAHPLADHQITIDDIRATIRRTPGTQSDCACFHLSDVYIVFPDGSYKRPDISVFCRRPANPRKPLTEVPEAVIEIVSEGYEAKDLVYGQPFYLSHGVKDVVVFNPLTREVRHVRRNAERRLTSPVEIAFECGCCCRI